MHVQSDSGGHVNNWECGKISNGQKKKKDRINACLTEWLNLLHFLWG